MRDPLDEVSLQTKLLALEGDPYLYCVYTPNMYLGTEYGSGWSNFLTHDLFFYPGWSYIHDDSILLSFRLVLT